MKGTGKRKYMINKHLNKVSAILFRAMKIKTATRCPPFPTQISKNYKQYLGQVGRQ